MASKDEASGALDLQRRQFLARAGGAGVLGLSALAAGWPGAAGAAGPTDMRGYLIGRYALELDGVFAGWVTGVAGGSVVANVAAVRDADFVQRKHVSGIRVEPITVQTGLPMAKPFLDWIKSSIEPRPKFLRKSGAIVHLDQNYAEVARHQFLDALITEVEFPAADAGSKQAVSFTVTLAPQMVHMSAGKGSRLSPSHVPARPWVSSNFRFFIKGLEEATRRAIKVGPVKASIATAPRQAGEFRAQTTVSGVLEVSNIEAIIPNQDLASMLAWHDDFVIKGNNGPERERVGVLEYWDATNKAALLTLQLFNLGIVSVAPDVADPAGRDRIARSRVEMYCESVVVHFNV